MIGMIRHAGGRHRHLGARIGGAVADSVTQILVAGCRRCRRRGAKRSRSAHRVSPRMRRSLVRQRWRDPGFGVHAIAAELRVSPSTLQPAGPAKLFARDWILGPAARTARGAICFCDPRAWGAQREPDRVRLRLHDAAHFACFPRRFGCAPREFARRLRRRRLLQRQTTSSQLRASVGRDLRFAASAPHPGPRAMILSASFADRASFWLA